MGAVGDMLVKELLKCRRNVAHLLLDLGKLSLCDLDRSKYVILVKGWKGLRRRENSWGQKTESGEECE